MNIAFIGTHGTGKTTLAEQLTSALNNKGYDATFKIDITRSLHSLGLPINEEGDVLTQILCFSEFYKKIILPNRNSRNIVICDRSLYDDLAYIEYCNIKNSHKVFLSTIIKKTLADFWDILFYIEPKYKLINDGVRSKNTSFQLEIDNLIRNSVIPIVKKTSKTTFIQKLNSIGFENEVEEALLFLLKVISKK